MAEVRYLSKVNTYNEVISIETPEPTKSYQSVSNKDIIDNLKLVVQHYGLNVTKEFYQLGRKNKQLFGAFTIEDKSTELQKCIGFRNSYDKSLPIGFVGGAEVIVCSNLMFEGEIMKVRKHTAYVYNDLQDIMENIVKGLDFSFDTITHQVCKLKEVVIDKQIVGDILTDMFMEQELITINQLSIFKDEYKKKESVNTEKIHRQQTGWDIMNHLTEALKKSHPSERMEKQLAVNKYLIDNLV